MLTLLEPPGAKRSQGPSNRSAQHLLHLAPDEDDYFDAETEYDIPNELISGNRNSFLNFLDRCLVWKSSSDEYNSRWKKEFRQRPSWCDADLCLQQIKRGKATGNQWALYSRSFIQKLLFSLGNFVQANAATVICTILILFSICCYGLQYVRIETDIVKLWVAHGGRLDEELNFLNKVQESLKFNDTDTVEIVRENGLGGGYQVIIQTPEGPGQNALSLEGLLKHVKIMEEIASMNVEVHGNNWTLHDICFKPAAPLGDDPMAKSFESIIERIVPCIWITPIDCFWEGGKALGPFPPVTKSDIGTYSGLMQSLPTSNKIKWTNFDPLAVITEIDSVAPLGSHFSFFERAGLGHGYLDRPCMNPLDPECPKLAPNYYDICPYIERFFNYTQSKGIHIVYETEDESGAAPDLFDSFLSFLSGDEEDSETNGTDSSNSTLSTITTTTTTTTTTTIDPKKLLKNPETACTQMRASAMEWMQKNREKWHEFLQEDEYPKFPNYGASMAGGCPGFAPAVLRWPEDMILGGTKRSSVDNQLNFADALQSVFLVASPNDVFLRFKDRINMTEAQKKSFKTARDLPVWNEEIAAEVIQAWQRNFTSRMYKHHDNFDNEGNERRTIHPLASTSIADMLEEFCQFNYTIIFVGYGLMLVYAMMTQFKREGCLPASQSCMGLALAGVLTVTFASVSGLGLATWFGIEFNAATTQIVPFLTLGIGVDNMFMLLHNYHDDLLMTGRHEMGILLRETGMSLLCTSINNILSFLAGTLLPIPALRSFCAQSSILLTFNFIAILTVYPAIISMDLRRRKAGRRDILCCLYGDTREENYSMISKPQIQQKRTIGEPSSCRDIPMTYKDLLEEVPESSFSLQTFIKNYYVPLLDKSWFRFFVLFGTCALMTVSIAGIYNADIGLELSDVLPEHTAPAKFLQARDKYFSFYPMFAVLKGPDIDYAGQQHLIESYRNSIAHSRFVIKVNNQPTEKYWLEMMREWLNSIQSEYETALDSGKIDLYGNVVGNVSDDAIIGLRLVCSFGHNYNCHNRVKKVKLVDHAGTIINDGFYNCLTAWFNQENMMYYVSQASFYPTPPKWVLDRKQPVLVPPADKLAYSQIPFYLTGLTDTSVIVTMIEEIRGICDNYTVNGLPNFPQGIAFTFWEQYLHLNGNLLRAIATIALAVFIVISLLLFNPWAALTILVILVAMTIELAGFLGFAGIKMNPVSAVTLITAVGIGVEFTAHVVLAYLTQLGTRPERTASAVKRVFVPVIHGAFSTLLGILMLGFSEFEFVVKYFFVVMSALIVIGIINGLILLPVLLYIAGPPQEITPLDVPPGREYYLPLPPPLPRKRQCREAETDDEDDSPGLMMRGHN
ncbi:unnamed protein product [Auanema sp. JU1783]|nr:unnamed protein product [Auanema sp. JU1783]